MVSSIYSNKKGIYKDLYRNIDSENKKQEKTIKRQRKGIYANLYRQFEDDANGVIQFRNKEREDKLSRVKIIQNAINNFISKLSFFSSVVAREFKLFILATILVNKPINSYIKNNLYAHSNQGTYYDGR